MSFKLKINELGAIRDSEIKFSPLMIFSGESKVGKSYTAFLVYHLISLLKNDWDNRIRDHIKSKYSNTLEEISKNRSGTIKFNAEDFTRWFNNKAGEYIGYLIGNKDFKCNIELIAPLSDFDITVQYPIVENDSDPTNILSNSVIFIVKETKKRDVDNKEESDRNYNVPESILKSRFEALIALIVSFQLRTQLFNNNDRFIPVLLPPARAGIVGYNFTELTKISSTAGMYETFIKDLDELKSAEINDHKPSNELNSLLENIFGGQIKVVENKLEYQISNSNNLKIPITAAASSIKELAPLFLMLSKYEANSLSILFEEPEAHLHPTMQQSLAYLLVYIINRGGYIQATTHSDYLLSQINNLIKLHTLRHKNNDKFKEAINKLGIKENLVLDPKIVGSYFFEKQPNGFVKIVKQNNVESGIPFDTFNGAVDKMMFESNLINDFLENYDN